MINLYFEKPKFAGIKLNNTFVTAYPFKVKLSENLLVEYIPFNSQLNYFSVLIEPSFDKQYNRLTFTKWDEQNYSVSYNPTFTSAPFEILQNEKILTKTYLLVSMCGYSIFALNNNSVEKVITLPKSVFCPQISITDSYIIVLGDSLDKKYILVLSNDYKVILSEFCNKITSNDSSLILSTYYDDSLGRTKTCYYSYKDNLSLSNVEFLYKKSSSTSLPLLFLEAYIAKDMSKIKEYLSFQTTYDNLNEYLGNFVIANSPIDLTNNIYLSFGNSNIRNVKRIKFLINNDKIDTFELY